MDQEVRRIKEKWDKSGSIYDRSVTEAQVNIWTLLSRLKELEGEFNNQVEIRNKLTIIKFELEAKIKELEKRIESAEATRDDALAYAKGYKSDALIMALRLLGEDENSFSPETREVMNRWRPKCLKLIKEKP